MGFIETNIRRTFIHHFFSQKKNVSDEQLLPLITAALDRRNPRRWYGALMDYGALALKKTPNANRRSKHYTRQSAFVGSDRQIRGAVIRALTTHPSLTLPVLAKTLDVAPPRLLAAITGLMSEGLVEKHSCYYRLP